MTNALIICEDGDSLTPRLSARFPDVGFHVATRQDEVAPLLQSTSPEIVFSIKTPGFSGPGHHQALMHPSVRWVQVGGSGYDHLLPIDKATAQITNCAGVLARHLAETVTGAILSLNGNFPQYREQQEAGDWRQIYFRSVVGQTLLVVGLGNIGRWVARNAQALGMHVIAVRGRPEPDPACDEVHGPEALMDLLGRADFVSLHTRLNDETRHMIGREALKAMKPTAHLINTARGGVVDEAVLATALTEKWIAGAYLDVFETEPLPPESPLWSLGNVMLTPHAADNISGWLEMFSDFFGDNLERFRSGEPLANLVN